MGSFPLAVRELGELRPLGNVQHTEELIAMATATLFVPDAARELI